MRGTSGQRASLLHLLPPLVLLVGAAVRLQTVLNPDVAWLLVAAGRMLDGGSYARDFFEINMPWSIAAYIPPNLLARFLGCSIPHALTLWTLLLALQSALLCLLVSPPAGVADQGHKPLSAVYLLFALIFLPLGDFGQKEHLAVMLFLPFLFHLARDQAAGKLLRIYISALAAFGFFMKPHFAPLPALLFAAAAYRRRSLAPLRSTEALVLVLAALADAILVMVRYPDWFRCADWAQDLYSAYRSPQWQWVLLTPQTGLLALMAVPCLARAWADRAYRAAAWPLLLAALYSALAYMLQFKGWSYQLLPALVTMFVALGQSFLIRPAAAPGGGRAWLVAAAAACLLVLAQVAVMNRQLPKASNLAKTNLAPVALGLSFAPKGGYVYVFTTNMTPAFPTVVLLDLKWASRFATLWPLAGIAADRPEAADSAYAQGLAQAVTEDFLRYRPDVVLVDLRDDQFGLPRHYDILGFFLRDNHFASVWRDYRQFGAVDGYAVYRLAPAPPVRGK